MARPGVRLLWRGRRSRFDTQQATGPAGWVRSQGGVVFNRYFFYRTADKIFRSPDIARNRAASLDVSVSQRDFIGSARCCPVESKSSSIFRLLVKSPILARIDSPLPSINFFHFEPRSIFCSTSC